MPETFQCCSNNFLCMFQILESIYGDGTNGILQNPCVELCFSLYYLLSTIKHCLYVYKTFACLRVYVMTDVPFQPHIGCHNKVGRGSESHRLATTRQDVAVKLSMSHDRPGSDFSTASTLRADICQAQTLTAATQVALGLNECRPN